MIESISISNTATYGTTPVIMDGLSKINFIFGANGTGKTTISRIIADESKYPSCRITWKGNAKIKTMVYNRDFVERNFVQLPELPGVFTLGEQQADILKNIETTKRDIDNLSKSIEGLTRTLQGSDGNGGRRADLTNLYKELQDKCWNIKKKYEVVFKKAFEGYIKSSQKFSEKVLFEFDKNKSQLLSFDELKNKAESIFTLTPEIEQKIADIDATNLLKYELNPILKKHVIGKDDVDIAAMIKKLNNSDWVNAGRRYYDVNNGICPFCQQKTTESFAKSLSEYFDETYIQDIQAINDMLSGYQSEVNNIQQKLTAILASPSRFLDIEKITAEIDKFKSKILVNIERLKEKKNEPSKAIELESLIDVIANIKDLINDANLKIDSHNKMVKNLEDERLNLIAQIWRFVIEELKIDINSFNTRRQSIEKAINEIENKIKTAKDEMKEKQMVLHALEKQTTSVQPTVDSINELLSKFGFTNFKLAVSNNGNSYKIIREDGSDAKTTLSEGEKSFITFLYFYHLLKGSNSEDDIVNDRIVVFDDPVSSLDGDILFIVSSLIKGLFDEVRAQTGNIKQIFILTHNVYFHKEVSFNPNRRALKDVTFWIVRKPNNESQIEKYNTNPIKTSYELLWAEVRNPKRSSLTIQNTLRRILENYFKILGGINPDDICEKFTGKDKLICKSLFSWVNDGSHYATDDLFISVEESQIDNYLRVFKEIFYKLRHDAHYKMMMGYAEEETSTSITASLDEAATTK